MAYDRQTWQDENPLYPVSAGRMNHMEQGIEDAHTGVGDAQGDIIDVQAEAGLWRTLVRNNSIGDDGNTAATYFFGTWGELRASPFSAISGATVVDSPQLIYLNATDFTRPGLTTKLRIRATCGVNATANANTFTFGLHPMTIAGSTDLQVLTAGTVVSGSTVAIASPAINTFTTSAGVEFNVPATGMYALCVVIASTITANSTVHCTALLQQRWV